MELMESVDVAVELPASSAETFASSEIDLRQDLGFLAVSSLSFTDFLLLLLIFLFVLKWCVEILKEGFSWLI